MGIWSPGAKRASSISREIAFLTDVQSFGVSWRPLFIRMNLPNARMHSFVTTGDFPDGRHTAPVAAAAADQGMARKIVDNWCRSAGTRKRLADRGRRHPRHHWPEARPADRRRPRRIRAAAGRIGKGAGIVLSDPSISVGIGSQRNDPPRRRRWPARRTAGTRCCAPAAAAGALQGHGPSRPPTGSPPARRRAGPGPRPSRAIAAWTRPTSRALALDRVGQDHRRHARRPGAGFPPPPPASSDSRAEAITRTAWP